MPRDKYADKAPLARFFHKYTGFIVMGSIALIVTTVWLWYDSQTVFFEYWNCADLTYMETDELTERELQRYNEIMEVDC